MRAISVLSIFCIFSLCLISGAAFAAVPCSPVITIHFEQNNSKFHNNKLHIFTFDVVGADKKNLISNKTKTLAVGEKATITLQEGESLVVQFGGTGYGGGLRCSGGGFPLEYVSLTSTTCGFWTRKTFYEVGIADDFCAIH